MARSQPPISPAADGTGTRVVPNGQRFDIDGGTRSRDGANLFHSFDRFGVRSGQSVNFLSSPEVQNILGRVTGGDPSIVNGLLEVTGGSSNLFLINPAGLVFGADARLDVPASFVVTTATGIGFGNGGWFDATGRGNWSDLVGDPLAFRFDRLQPGRLVNFGNLEVATGGVLSLLGGVVVNAGNLVAPEGSVNVVAVEGGRMLRLSTDGHLLSLEIEATDAATAPLSLAELLTGNAIDRVDRLVISETGAVMLSGSGMALPDEGGDAIAAGTIDVSGALGGNANVLGNRVALLGTIDASGAFGGGNILVGGDLQGRGPIPTAEFTFVGADAAIDVSALRSGNGGTAIVWANDTTRFLGDISARGGALGGNGGFVETSGANRLQVLGRVDAIAPNGLAGSWLLDPNNITIQDAGPDTNVTGDPDFTTTDDGAIVTTASIEASLNAGVSVTVTTGSAGTNSEFGDIIVRDPIQKMAGGDAALTLNAARDILVNEPIFSTMGALDVTLNAMGGVRVDADIGTNGGNFVATGASGLSAPPIPSPDPHLGIGVFIDAAIDVGGGSIAIVGTGGNNASNENHGILIDSSGGDVVRSTGSGTISLTGTAGSGIDDNSGVRLGLGGIVRADGNITAIGTGNGSGNDNGGITIMGTLESLGGTIDLTGNGGNGGTDSAHGVIVDTGTVRASGDILLHGTGGDGLLFNDGVSVFSAGTVESAGGSVTLVGTGGNGTNDNSGIRIGAFSSVRSENGDITLTGTGNGTGIDNNGLRVAGTIASTGSGSISLAGTGGNSIDESHGIFTVSGSIIGSATGSITLQGTGNNTGVSNDGLQLAGRIESTGSGAIALSGVGNSTTNQGNGISIDPNGRVRTGGNIALTGTGNGTGAENDGIELLGVLEATGAGSMVSLDGTSNGTGGDTNRGINIVGPDATILSGGTIALTGAAGNGTFDNSGIRIAGSVPTIAAGGTISLVGTGNGANDRNHGISIESGTIESTGSGAIAATGVGADGTNQNLGIVTLISSIVRTGGNITFMGTGGNGTGTANDGVAVLGPISATGAGAIALTGAASPGNSAFQLGGSLTAEGPPISLNVASGDLIETDPIVASGSDFEIFNPVGNIVLGAIDTSDAAGGGNVTLEASGNITAAYINTQSSGGPGGNVRIVAGQFVRLNGTFSASNSANASISTIGNPGGNIFIQHGGNGTTPFDVALSPAPAPPTANGTDGALTRGPLISESTLANDSFLFNHSQDGNAIEIIAIPPIPPPAPPPPRPHSPRSHPPHLHIRHPHRRGNYRNAPARHPATTTRAHRRTRNVTPSPACWWRHRRRIGASTRATIFARYTTAAPCIRAAGASNPATNGRSRCPTSQRPGRTANERPDRATDRRSGYTTDRRCDRTAAERDASRCNALRPQRFASRAACCRSRWSTSSRDFSKSSCQRLARHVPNWRRGNNFDAGGHSHRKSGIFGESFPDHEGRSGKRSRLSPNRSRYRARQHPNLTRCG